MQNSLGGILGRHITHSWCFRFEPDIEGILDMYEDIPVIQVDLSIQHWKINPKQKRHLSLLLTVQHEPYVNPFLLL